MSSQQTTFLRLLTISLVTLVTGIWYSDFQNTAIVGAHGHGNEYGLQISPLVYIGMLFLALAVGWYRLGRN